MPKLYLHETIQIIGTGSEPYKRHTAEWAATRREGGALVGIWQQSGSTGDWPRVVNLWEMDGWDHWARILERQYAGAGQPPALRRWWTRMAKWRAGGFDRILEPASFSPTRDELVVDGVRARACLQEIVTTLPGAADGYLDAVATRRLEALRARGVALLGAYRTAMRDTEVVLLWGFATFADFTKHLADQDGQERWGRIARTWRTDYRETLLVPSTWCVTHPEWRPQAAAGRRRRRE
jgi:hypothetical protein